MKTVYSPASSTPYLKSMVSCLSRVVDDGYIEDFRATLSGLQSLSTKKIYSSSQVRLVNFFRFVGFAGARKNAVLYVLETNDGTKGTLINAGSNQADSIVNRFMLDVLANRKR